MRFGEGQRCGSQRQFKKVVLENGPVRLIIFLDFVQMLPPLVIVCNSCTKNTRHGIYMRGVL